MYLGGTKEPCITSGPDPPMQRGNFEVERGGPLGLPAMNCVKTAEQIELPFGIWTRMVSRKHVLNGDAHWRHLANTIEPSMCSSDVTVCQITLTTCSICIWLFPNDIDSAYVVMAPVHK